MSDSSSLPPESDGEAAAASHRFALAPESRDRALPSLLPEACLELLARAFDQSSSRVLLTDLGGKVEFAAGSVVGSQAAARVGETAPVFAAQTSLLNREGRDLDEILGGRVWRDQFEIQADDGRPYWESCTITPVKDAQGLPSHFLVVTEDITQRKLFEQSLFKQRRYDELTGLPNRTYFTSLMRRTLDRCLRQGENLALLSVDLDRLHNINDTFGHAIGDELLARASVRLRELLRPNDVVGRFGGDNFIALLPGLSTSEAEVVAERVLETFSEPIAVEHRSLVVTCTIGVTMAPADGNRADELIRNADTALHRAKEKGRNRHCLFTPDLNAKVRERLALETALRNALVHGQLSLLYQPIFDLEAGRVVGVECLSRWRHPTWGDVPPDQFIPIAEETGLISEIGDAALAEACRQARSWVDEGLDLYIAVNVSSRQCRDSAFKDRILEVLRATGLAGSHLVLEITESMLKEDLGHLVETAEALRPEGVRFSIDDFGTGYSSLSLLSKLPIDVLKIDRSFVSTIAESLDARSLPEAIIAMSHGLNLKVVAEGVESEVQLDLLRLLGCDLVQGFHVSRPIGAAEVAAFARRGLLGTSRPA